MLLYYLVQCYCWNGSHLTNVSDLIQFCLISMIFWQTFTEKVRCMLSAEIMTILLDSATMSSSVMKTATDYPNMHITPGFCTLIFHKVYSVATCLRCGEVSNIHIILYFYCECTYKKSLKIGNIWQIYDQKFSGWLLWITLHGSLM